ncbi:hypothetical protein NLI96_g9053 [Meripilus lineatus]|uniref:3-dehydroquinate dehydratase n=1 Tax=Meripilus lineatus TaxID=2056292 RepID=A0AAD5YDD8_9APHY|nr:hypothetical protein NLI96_g9053 [Physisporinus lineatus]
MTEATGSSSNMLQSVVLVGMRGSGKSFIGKLAAAALGWAFVDADIVFEEKHKIGVRDFVRQRGWPAFREAESQLATDLLESHSLGHVISFGGGVVEVESARQALVEYSNKGPVVHITREEQEIIKYLNEETDRPPYGESVSDVLHRRQPWFANCSNFEYINPVDIRHSTKVDAQGDLSHSLHPNIERVRRDVARFFGHVTGQHPNLAPNLVNNKRSYFLCLTYPDLTPALSDIEELTTGADAIELRVDLLHSPQDPDDLSPYIPPVDYVFSQLAALRQHSDLPIVFTARTTSEGGKFPSSSSAEAFELFHTALRHGVEYIDVEMAWPTNLIQNLVSQKGQSQIVASYHDWSGNLKWDSKVVEDKYWLGESFADIVKIVGKANVLEDNFALHNFVEQKRASGAKPIIAINMGFEGKLSRVLNRTFSPVTHPLLPNKAAPGQMSLAEIQTTLHSIGQLPPLRFYGLGKHPLRSLLPTLFNSAFETLGLPHHFELAEDKSLGDLSTSPDFGGALISSPFTLDVPKLPLSPDSSNIGVVDTVTAENEGKKLTGENAEWQALRASILSRLPLESESLDSALVIGGDQNARSAIYTLQRLGVKTIFLAENSSETAHQLLETFSRTDLRHLHSVDQYPSNASSPSIIINTSPTSSINLTPFEKPGGSPGTIFANPLGGVVIDMTFKTLTPLLERAGEAGPRWKLVNGFDVTCEQVFSQFYMWTGRRCPRKQIHDIVKKASQDELLKS